MHTMRPTQFIFESLRVGWPIWLNIFVLLDFAVQYGIDRKCDPYTCHLQSLLGNGTSVQYGIPGARVGRQTIIYYILEFFKAHQIYRFFCASGYYRTSTTRACTLHTATESMLSTWDHEFSFPRKAAADVVTVIVV